MELILLPRAEVTVMDELATVGQSACLAIASRGEPLLWLAVDRGFAVKKYSVSLSHPEVTRMQIVNDRYLEISPGFWIPTQGRIQFYGPEESGATEELLVETLYSFTGIQVNRPIAESVFDIAFSPSARVADWVPWTTRYRVPVLTFFATLVAALLVLLYRKQPTFRRNLVRLSMIGGLTFCLFFSYRVVSLCRDLRSSGLPSPPSWVYLVPIAALIVGCLAGAGLAWYSQWRKSTRTSAASVT